MRAKNGTKKRALTFFLVILATFSLLLLLSPFAAVAGGEVQIPTELEGGEGEGEIGKVQGLLDMVMTWVVRIGLLIGAMSFAYGAILWITSGGNDMKIQKAKKALLYSVGGVALLVLSISLVAIIVNALGGSFSWNPF
ncbi:MAG: hypothetical protein QXH08_00170 [Candidatus Hadarchaeales archaeon]